MRSYSKAVQRGRNHVVELICGLGVPIFFLNHIRVCDTEPVSAQSSLIIWLCFYRIWLRRQKLSMLCPGDYSAYQYFLNWVKITSHLMFSIWWVQKAKNQKVLQCLLRLVTILSKMELIIPTWTWRIWSTKVQLCTLQHIGYDEKEFSLTILSSRSTTANHQSRQWVPIVHCWPVRQRRRNSDGRRRHETQCSVSIESWKRKKPLFIACASRQVPIWVWTIGESNCISGIVNYDLLSCC